MAIDDYGDTTRTAGKFITDKTTGETAATGKIDLTDDLDWFVFRGKPNTYYKINLDNTALLNGELNLYVSDSSKFEELALPFGPKIIANDVNDALENTWTLEFLSDNKARNFYVQVAGSTTTAGYTVKLEEVIDDYLSSRLTKTALIPGTPLTGSIQWTDFDAAIYSDKDWLKLSATADTFYTIKLKETTAIEEFEKGELALFGRTGLPAGLTPEDGNGTWEAGEYLITGDENDADGEIELTFLSKGSPDTYYVEVSDQGDNGGKAGAFDYELSATAIVDDYIATTKTKGILTDGVAGKIDWAGDKDWFKFSATANMLYEIKLNDSAISLEEVNQLGMLKIFDYKGDALTGDLSSDEGQVVDESLLLPGKNYCIVGNDDGTNSLLFIAGPAGGNYFVEVGADEAVETSATGSYTLNIISAEDDYSDSAQTKGILKDGLMGKINYVDDVDWIKFSAAANTAYTITLDDESVDNPLYNGILQLRDRDGDPLKEENDDGTIEPDEYYILKNEEDGTVSLTLLKTDVATYYIDVSADLGATGNYAFNVDATPEYSDDKSKTRTTLKESTPISSAIDFESTDVDCFKLSVSKGNYYRITLDDETLDDALATGILKIETRTGAFDGDLIKNVEDADGKYTIEFLADKSATYYVSVEEDGTGNIGNYELSVEKFTDDYADSNRTKGILKPTKPTEGSIDWVNDDGVSEVDYLKLSAAGNSLYRIVITENDANNVKNLADIKLLDSLTNSVVQGTAADGITIVEADGVNAPAANLNVAFEIQQPDNDTWIIALYNSTKKTSSFFLELSANDLIPGLLDLGYTVTTERYASGVIANDGDAPLDVIGNLDPSFWAIA